MVKDGQMLEHAHVFGHFYGSPIAGPVRDAIEGGPGRAVRRRLAGRPADPAIPSSAGDSVLSIFLLPPSIAELRRRLEADAGQDPADVIARADGTSSWDEISHWDGYDYVLVNDDLAIAEERACARSSRPSGLRRRQSARPAAEHVRQLQAEFEEQVPP